MNKEVLETDLEKIITISKEFGAERILLFGSCLEDIESARDIDIAVSGINPRYFFKYYGKVSMEADVEVDIVDLDDVRKHLCKRILSKGRVVYERAV